MPQEKNDNDYAVVIGINHYRKFRPLNGPLGDSAKFRDWLLSSDGGFMPRENCEYIISQEQSLLPIQDQVDEAFVHIFERISQKGVKARRLYFYFNGHGLGLSTEDTAMVLPKWTLDFRDYALSSSKYKRHLIDKGLFSEIFIFLDCCRNRMVGVEGAKPYFSSAKPGEGAPKTTSFIYSASEFDSSAFETSQLSEGSTEVSGLFTQVLMNGLKGGAVRPPSTSITAESLRDFIRSHLPALAKDKGLVQFPRYSAENMEGDVLIVDLPQVPEVEVSIRFSQAGLQVKLEDAATKLIRDGDTSAPWTLRLPAGNYYLSRPDSTEIRELVVSGNEKNMEYVY